MLTTLFSALLLLTPTVAMASPTTTSEAAAIDVTLVDFTQGAAERDLARVSRALHPEARQYVAMPDGLQVMDTPTYLGLLEAEKIGGTETARVTEAVSVSGTHAQARQTRDIGAMVLHDAITLVQDAGRWQIVAVAVRVETK